ncbi:MAG TPA: hypothetical protein VHT30_01270 [Acidimicrobiales bacterium]|jgi:hypothetical protein|nr:hypothetical protein [Acidimicrobiales bacterium]
MVNEDVVKGNQQAIIGESDHEQHRAGPGEGVRAPLTSEGADHPEFSIFDGKGNESVVVVAPNAEGRPAEGTGPDAAAAMADAKRPGNQLGEDFGPVTGE